jgi:hypothetical protein
MRYRVNSPWPVQGGAAVIPTGAVIDTATSAFLQGVVPPPDVTCLDQECTDVLHRAYVMAFRS